MKLIGILLVLSLAGMAYVRFAPSDVARWHQAMADFEGMDAPQEIAWAGGIKRLEAVAGGPVAALQRFERVALATPRTVLLAGSAEEGRMTFVTRSRVLGFPDYSTVTAEAAAKGTRLIVHGRQRFGSADFGVNATRVAAWIKSVRAME